MLCERGVKGFDKATRNLYDVASVAVVKGLSHLPIIVDPSHATGRPDLIPPCALAGVAVGRGRRAHRSSRLPGAGQVGRAAGPAAASSMRRWWGRFGKLAAMFGQDDLDAEQVRAGDQDHGSVSRRIVYSSRHRDRYMRRKFIAGNWKMNTTRAEGGGAGGGGGGEGRRHRRRVEVAVCPPSVYLEAVGQAIKGSAVGLGAQNCYHEAKGAFTGEISPAMLRRYGLQVCDSGPQRAAADFQGDRART